jgi:hypothetical protein
MECDCYIPEILKYYEYSFDYLIIIMNQLRLMCYLVYSTVCSLPDTDLWNLLNSQPPTPPQDNSDRSPRLPDRGGGFCSPRTCQAPVNGIHIVGIDCTVSFRSAPMFREWVSFRGDFVSTVQLVSCKYSHTGSSNYNYQNC